MNTHSHTEAAVRLGNSNLLQSVLFLDGHQFPYTKWIIQFLNHITFSFAYISRLIVVLDLVCNISEIIINICLVLSIINILNTRHLNPYYLFEFQFNIFCHSHVS